MRPAIIALILAVTPAVAGAQTQPAPQTQRISAGTHNVLRGITSVHLVVDAFNDDDAEKDGLAAEAIQKDVEMRLKAAGIHPLTDEELKKAPGAPTLYVYVGAQKVRSMDLPLYVYCIQMAYEETVRLDRDPTTIVSNAVLWKKDTLGVAGADTMQTQVQFDITDLLALFTRDHTAANAKK